MRGEKPLMPLEHNSFLISSEWQSKYSRPLVPALSHPHLFLFLSPSFPPLSLSLDHKRAFRMEQYYRQHFGLFISFTGCRLDCCKYRLMIALMISNGENGRAGSKAHRYLPVEVGPKVSGDGCFWCSGERGFRIEPIIYS